MKKISLRLFITFIIFITLTNNTTIKASAKENTCEEHQMCLKKVTKEAVYSINPNMTYKEIKEFLGNTESTSSELCYDVDGVELLNVVFDDIDKICGRDGETLLRETRIRSREHMSENCIRYGMLDDFLLNFLEDYERAKDEKDFSLIELYLLKDSDFYESQKSFIESYKEEVETIKKYKIEQGMASFGNDIYAIIVYERTYDQHEELLETTKYAYYFTHDNGLVYFTNIKKIDTDN